jgi:dTDP-4-amino-4,6-dideoxygalactose transaminase
MERYPVFQPFIDAEEVEACRAALDCKYLGMGSFVGQFESELADFMQLGNQRQVLAFSTGHAALHLALMLLDVGLGDEVITPSFNNIADFQAISAVGAIPVFCDITEPSLCIDPTKIPALINEKTKAIIAIDYGARLADHATLRAISKQYGIPVIHDAAHSFGSRYQSMHVGHQHALTMLSFDPIKNITCIDGGALIFEDERYATPLREMRLIGMSQKIGENYSNKRDWKYDVHRLGFRYHMPNLHAAIGLAQVRKFAEIKRRRQLHYQIYHRRLSGHPIFTLQGSLQPDIVPFILCLRVRRENREGLIQHLGANNIETGFHWTPGHQFSMYSGCRSGGLSVTERIAEEIISLPFFPRLEESDIDVICDVIDDYCARL